MDADTGEQWGEDPGWRPSLRMLIPFAVLIRRRDPGRDPITTLRILYLSFITALFLYGLVLSLISPFRSEDDGMGWAIAIAALAVVNLVVVRLIERPLSCESDEALGTSYRTRFFLRLAFAETTALLGFVSAFIIRGNWIYFFSVLCSLPGFIRAAPTKADLIRDQDDLTGRGCGLSLVEAIRRTPPK